MTKLSCCGVIAGVLASFTPHAFAEERTIVVETPRDRTMSNKVMVGSMFGAGVLLGGLGLKWHLDSRSAANEVASNVPTGRAWSQADVAQVEKADDAGTKAIVAYGVGGALLIAAVVTFIVTDPGSETTVLKGNTITPTVAPAPGGAVLGSSWSF
ncbi:MAG: hypothetical protein AB7O24_07330 [Kofleriaceae bacterium]